MRKKVVFTRNPRVRPFFLRILHGILSESHFKKSDYESTLGEKKGAQALLRAGPAWA